MVHETEALDAEAIEVMLTIDLAGRAEHLLRTHQQFRHNSLELLRFLILPAHGEYECWRVIRHRLPGTGGHEFVGVHGRWNALQDAAELFDPATGKAVRDDVEPTLTWRSVTLAPDMVDAFVRSMRGARIRLMCAVPFTGADSIRYEAQLTDPDGSAAVTSMLSWVAVPPVEWQPVDIQIRNVVAEIRRLMGESA